jgi:uncharacterized protein (DUF305 family)
MEMHMNRRDRVAAILLATVMLIASLMSATWSGAPSEARRTDEAPFLAENAGAMDKMMAGMAVKPTGDIDGDFAAMMIPHHQGAIDMAVAYLRYGNNEQLRRIAQEIIVEQWQEIAAMRMALGQPLPRSAAAQTQIVPGQSTATQVHDHSSMTHGAMPMSPEKPVK